MAFFKPLIYTVKYNIIILFLLFVATSCKNAHNNISKTLQKNPETIFYDVNYKKKVFFKNDTTSINYGVYLKKNKKDSLYGYDFYLKGENETLFNIEDTLYTFNTKKHEYIKSIHKSYLINQLYLIV